MKFAILFLVCPFIVVIQAKFNFLGWKPSDLNFTQDVQPSVANEKFPKLRFYFGSVYGTDPYDVLKIRVTNLGNLKNAPYITQFAKKPTILFCYGWLGASVTADSNGDFVQSAAAVTYFGYMLPPGAQINFLTIEWSAYNNGEFFNVISELSPIANAIGDELTAMALAEKNPVDLSTWHLMGHSLGAHMVGLIARRIKENSGGKIIMPRITGLDPAGPFINYPITSHFFPHLEKTDAKFVDIIHTDPVCLGSSWKLGHMDFWPNHEQQNQPGCPRGSTFDFIFFGKNACSHLRAYELYAASAYYGRDYNPKKFYPAVRCEKNLFGKLNCTNDIIYMGYNIDIKAPQGDYYLMTSSQFPYDLGMDGISVYKANGKIPGDDYSFE